MVLAVQDTGSPLTEQEKEWINAILQTNKAWADVTLGEIYMDVGCTCGCLLERPRARERTRSREQGRRIRPSSGCPKGL